MYWNDYAAKILILGINKNSFRESTYYFWKKLYLNILLVFQYFHINMWPVFQVDVQKWSE